LLTQNSYTRRLSELRKKTNNPLFKNELIRELSELSDMKRFIDSKNLKFETLSDFTRGGFIDKYTQNELYQRVGSLCGTGPLAVGQRYRANALDDAIFSMNSKFDILFLQNKSDDNVLGFVIAELGECAREPNVYAVNLICSQSGLGKLLLGACLYCIKFNDDVSEKKCILELAHAYKNTAGFFMYTKLGFNLDDSLIGKEGECFFDYLHIPMSVILNDDKFTQQYFVDMMVRSDFKQADVNDPTEIYDLGLPKKDTEDGGKSSALQREMVQLANIVRKIKVFGTSIEFPQDEWEIIKELPFAKKRIFINKPRSQPNFNKKLTAKPDLAEPLLDEVVREFDKLKRHYMRSKGMDVPPTPTAQLETAMPEQELVLAETVSAPPAETRKKTTEKQLITMSMMPRRTTRKTTSKRRTPRTPRTPTAKRRRTPSKHKTPRTPTAKRRRTPSKHRTPSKKTPTPRAKRNYDMATVRTYNTRKRTKTTYQKGGIYDTTLRGKPIEKMVLSSDNLDNVIFSIGTHEYIRKISPKKIVATPNSGSEPSRFIESWKRLNEEEIKFFTEFWFPRRYGVILGVYINEDPEWTKNKSLSQGNRILFYSVEYLDLLQQATTLSSHELLQILSNVQSPGTYQYDIILIAFGDLYGNIPGVEETLRTEEGKKVFEIYKRLADIRS
jgi:hypothetical protein